MNRNRHGLLGAAEVCEAAGVSPARLDLMVRCSIVVPAEKSTGRGHPAGFDYVNIVKATQGDELLRAGLSTRQTYRIIAPQEKCALEALGRRRDARQMVLRLVQ